VALTWQGAWRHRHWRHALAPCLGNIDLGAKSPHFSQPPLPPRVILVFFLLLFGFFLCTLRPTSSIDLLDREKLDFIRRSSRTRYPFTLPYLFRIDLVK
jgi:hypothetical protein